MAVRQERASEAIANIPENFSLLQNYPNPFNPKTIIQYQLPKGNHHVSIKVYNVLGNEVAVLVEQDLSSGIYSVEFDASKLASGLYFYKFTTPHFSQVRKMFLSK